VAAPPADKHRNRTVLPSRNRSPKGKRRSASGGTRTSSSGRAKGGSPGKSRTGSPERGRGRQGSPKAGRVRISRPQTLSDLKDKRKLINKVLHADDTSKLWGDDSSNSSSQMFDLEATTPPAGPSLENLHHNSPSGVDPASPTGKKASSHSDLISRRMMATALGISMAERGQRDSISSESSAGIASSTSETDPHILPHSRLGATRFASGTAPYSMEAALEADPGELSEPEHSDEDNEGASSKSGPAPNEKAFRVQIYRRTAEYHESSRCPWPARHTS